MFNIPKTSHVIRVLSFVFLLFIIIFILWNFEKYGKKEKKDSTTLKVKYRNCTPQFQICRQMSGFIFVLTSLCNNNYFYGKVYETNILYCFRAL